jgi:hypothetical protein
VTAKLRDPAGNRRTVRRTLRPRLRLSGSASRATDRRRRSSTAPSA